MGKLNYSLEALQEWAKQSKQSLETQNEIAEYRIRLNRKQGEWIEANIPKEGRAAPVTENSHGFVTLAEAGIDRNDSPKFRLLAKIPQERFEQFITETKAKSAELTSAGLHRFAIRQKFGDSGDIPPLPAGIFNVIYADPPWRYENILPEWGPAQLHYPTLTLERLCALEIPATSDAVLFLWVTNPFLRSALELVDAWGFEYKTNMVWVKTHLKYPGSGFYVRGRHELLFICTKGSFVPDQTGKEPIGSVIEAPVGEHSQKPVVVYDIIEKMYPQGQYLELFARNRRKGWKSWGNEIEERQRQVAGG
jgi:N6-adenosine-specific RNA methylase IME4